MKTTLMVEIINNLEDNITGRLARIHEIYRSMDILNHECRMLASNVDNDCKLLEALMVDPDCHENLTEKRIQNIEVLLENARDTIQSCFGNDDTESRLNNASSDLEDLYERFMRNDYKTTEAVAAQQACLNASENICMILSYLRKRHQ